MSERKAGLLALIISLKPCCILLWTTSFVGGGGGILGTLGDFEVRYVLPFIAWPAVLYTCWQLWQGHLYFHKNPDAPRDNRMILINRTLGVVATSLFLHSFVTAYIPAMQGGMHHH